MLRLLGSEPLLLHSLAPRIAAAALAGGAGVGGAGAEIPQWVSCLAWHLRGVTATGGMLPLPRSAVQGVLSRLALLLGPRGAVLWLLRCGLHG